MTLTLGQQVPNFHADTTQGSIDFYEWAAQSWVLLVSHPKQFRPVCATELAQLARLSGEFSKRNIKVLALNADSLQGAERWAVDILETQGVAVNFPVIFDPERRIASMYGMMHPEMSAVAPMRTTFIISPDKHLRVTLALPSSLGRDFNDVLRMCDSLQLTDTYKVATPAGWQSGDDVIIVPGMSEEEAKLRFPDGWHEKRPYLRMVPQPGPKDAASVSKAHVTTRKG